MGEPDAEAPPKPSDEVCSLLQELESDARTFSDLMNVCTKHILTDQALREQLRSTGATLQQWQSTARDLQGKLRDEVKELNSMLEVSAAARKELLIGKRKLQLSMRDMKRKTEAAEAQLNEVMKRLEDDATDELLSPKTRAQDLEKKLIVAETNLAKSAQVQSEHEAVEADLQDLQDKVAQLTTDIEEQRELHCTEAEKQQAIISRLRTDLENARASLQLKGAGDTPVIELEASRSGRTPAAPPRRSQRQGFGSSMRSPAIDGDSSSKAGSPNLFQSPPTPEKPASANLLAPESIAINAATGLVCLALGYFASAGSASSKTSVSSEH
ncbi:hypothetical protein DIPPA_70081 [Diplonema papillatum]|nr:hypothetical protein DIPPA_70081 [Diplonema papillatum]